MTSSIQGIIIILGSPNSKQGDLYNVAKQRCELAIQEYLKHPDWKIVLTGGYGAHFNEAVEPHAYYLHQYLIERGVPSRAIVDSVMSTNTLEDASLSKPTIIKYNIQNLIVVTSDYHYDRAQYIFEREYSNNNLRIQFSLCHTDENTCEFDLKSQKVHEEEALKKLKEITENKNVK